MMLPQLLLESLQPGPFPVFPFPFPFSLYFPFTFSLLPFLVIINFPFFFPIVCICICVVCSLVVLSLMCPSLALNSLYIFWTSQVLASTSQVLRLQVSDTSPGFHSFSSLFKAQNSIGSNPPWQKEVKVSAPSYPVLIERKIQKKMSFTSTEMCKMSGQDTADDALGFGEWRNLISCFFLLGMKYSSLATWET